MNGDPNGGCWQELTAAARDIGNYTWQCDTVVHPEWLNRTKDTLPMAAHPMWWCAARPDAPGWAGGRWQGRKAARGAKRAAR